MPYRFGPFRLDPQREELWRADSLVPLNRKAVRLLIALVERHGEIVSKEELLEAVWPQRKATANNLTQHVFMVRSALGEATGEQRYLLTVPGVGYRFVAPLERGERDSAQRIIARNFCEVARDFCLRRTPACIERAIELYTRAIQYDPRCVDALAGLALCRFLLAEYIFETPREALSLAEQEALRTLELDRKNPIALVVLARAAAQLRYHWSESETLLLDAFRSRPDDLWAHVHLVEHYIARGRLAQARQALAHAYTLSLADDPFPRLPLLQGALLYFEHDFSGAQMHLEALLAEHGTYGLARLYLAKALLAQGRFGDGVEHAEQATRIRVEPLSPGQPDVRRRALALCVLAHALRGDTEAMREAAARLDAFTLDLPQSSMCAAIVALAYGRRDRALRAMESAVANRESYCAFAALDPLLAPLHSLPGWRPIVRAMNLAS